MHPEFNLLDEPWIKVLDKNYEEKEVPIKDVLIHAHEFLDLAGETRSQDTAVFRMLLAIVLTVFSRTDVNGNKEPVDADNAVDRWEELWNNEKFPEKPVIDYLERYRDRFYLFHPKYPFYQIPEVENMGTKYTAAKLNGEISESNHNPKLFPMRRGSGKESLPYAEAARWLLFINGFDDAALKKAGENKKEIDSVSVSWLGQLGIVMPAGKNLFETLMLNMTFLRDGYEEWGESKPIWETKPRTKERNQIAVPDNYAELLTLQSRRIFLLRKDGRVTGFRAIGGDRFDGKNAIAEQMTAWKYHSDKTTGEEYFSPMRHDSSKQAWRNFGFYVKESKDQRIPGVIKWLMRLQDEEVLADDRMFALKLTSVYYESSMSSVNTEEFDDAITFDAVLLSEKGKVCQDYVLDEIRRCEKRADYLSNMAKDIARASGLREEDKKDKKKDKKKETPMDRVGNLAKEDYFYKIDAPFRRWMLSLDPEKGMDDIQKKRDEWNEWADKEAITIAHDLTDKAGLNAFVGRKDPDTGEHYSSPEALNTFFYHIAEMGASG